MRLPTSVRRLLPGLLLALIGSAAHAHGGELPSAPMGFLAGLLHPLSGLDHMAAMLAVGVWSALVLRSVWVAPLAFVLAMDAGVLAGFAGWDVPLVEPMIAASLLVIGLLITLRQPLSVLSAGALVGLFALFHGAAHGAELGDLSHGPALLGMMAGTALLQLAGVALARLVLSRHAWLPQWSGLLVALLGGVMMLRSMQGPL